jgi:very-short-patch-repair endonuclease
MIERARSKNRSVPCERLKEWLKKGDIQFVEEFQPLRHRGRYFSIDIAFPDKKIGIEVNGNQHYEKDGTLSPSYQDRHDQIEAEGWTLYEIHYPVCFVDEAIAKMVDMILASPTRVQFDYGTYRVPKLVRTRKHSKGDNSWRKQPRPNARKVPRPSREELEKLVWAKPVIQVAKDFGLTGNSVVRWCNELGVKTPPCRYWPRRKAGRTHEEALLPIELPKPSHRITPDVLAQIVSLRQAGLKWTKIGRAVGFGRSSVKAAYEKMVLPAEVASA